MVINGNEMKHILMSIIAIAFVACKAVDGTNSCEDSAAPAERGAEMAGAWPVSIAAYAGPMGGRIWVCLYDTESGKYLDSSTIILDDITPNMKLILFFQDIRVIDRRLADELNKQGVYQIFAKKWGRLIESNDESGTIRQCEIENALTRDAEGVAVLIAKSLLNPRFKYEGPWGGTLSGYLFDSSKRGLEGFRSAGQNANSADCIVLIFHDVIGCDMKALDSMFDGGGRALFHDKWRQNREAMHSRKGVTH